MKETCKGKKRKKAENSFWEQACTAIYRGFSYRDEVARVGVRSLGSAGLFLALKCSLFPALGPLGGWLGGTRLAHEKWTCLCSAQSKEAANRHWLLTAACTNSHSAQLLSLWRGHRAGWLQEPGSARLRATWAASPLLLLLLHTGSLQHLLESCQPPFPLPC